MRPATLRFLALAGVLVACTPDRDRDPDLDVPDASQPDGGADGGGVACGPSSCDGCCLPDGRCVAGDEVASCGTGGAACLDCSGPGLCGADRTCALDPDRGESCASPIPLALVNDVASVTGSLAAKADEGAASCGGGGGGDVVFQVTTPARGGLYLRLRYDEGSAPVLSVRSACDAVSSELPGACDRGFFGLPLALDLSNLEAGTYFVWLDNAGGTAGSFTLDVAFSAGLGDRCDTARPISLVGGEAHVTGSFLGARADGAVECNSYEGLDTHYGLVTTRRGNLIATVRGRDDLGATLQVNRGCPGDSLGCSWVNPGEASEVRLGGVDPGHYVFAIESSVRAEDATANDFTLDVRLVDPPANDRCQGARTLTLVDGVATATGSTLDADHDAPEACFDGGGDVYYRLVTTEVLDVALEVQGTKPGVRPAVTLLEGACGRTHGECSMPSESGSSGLSIHSLGPGTYDVVVDSEPGAAGDFALTVRAQPPAGGESCAAPSALSFATGAGGVRTATVREDIQPFGKDDPLDCSDGWNIRHDVSYGFSLTEPANVTVGAQWAAADGGILYVRLLKGDCVRDNSLACEGEYMNQIHPIQLGAVPPGDYRIVVSAFLSYEDEAAPFDLTVTLTPPPPGEGCSNPIALSIPGDTGGEVTVRGDSSTFLRDLGVKCSTNDYRSDRGRDVVYAFTTTVAMNLAATVTTTDPYFRSALLLRRPDTCTGLENVLCDADRGSWNAEGHSDLAMSGLPAGTWILVVDALPRQSYTSDKDGGAYELKLTLTPTKPGETCDNPLPLAFSNGAAGGAATITGSTVGMVNDTGVCSGAAPEIVYAFTIDRELNFRGRLTGGRNLAIAPGACTDYVDVICDDEDGEDTDGALDVGSLKPGTYKVIVDDQSSWGSGFSYTLNATLTPPAQGDTCANPLPVTFTGGTATITGDTASFFDHDVPCDGNDPDVAYRFTLDRPQNFTARIEAAAGGTFEGDLSLVRDCAAVDSSSCYSSKFLGKESLSIGSLAAGTWLLLVDGRGRYEVTATVADPPPGDSCANPAPLFPAGQSSGTVTKQVDPAGFFDDATPPCDSYPGSGRDVLYRFTTTQPMSLRAKAETAQQYAYGPNLYVLPAGCSGAAAACKLYGYTNRTTVLEKGFLPAGDWVLVVDAQGDQEMYMGPYTLTVTLTPPAPGETCSNAIPLAFPNGANGGAVKVTGNTTDSFDDVESSCSGGGTATRGHDVAYTFTTTTTMNLRVKLASLASTFKPSVFHAVAATGGGCTYDSRMCGYVPSYTDSEITDYGSIPPGTHYLVVDGLADKAGAFELDVKLLPILQGETCANPIPLNVSSGTARATGEISSWFPDHRASCDTDSEDAVYTFSTSQTRYVRASITTTAPESAYVPSLYLRSGACATGTEGGCMRGSDGKVTVAASLPAGQHYVFVDASIRQQNAGAYTLDVFVGDPPQGDTCSNPIPIALSNGVAGGTARVTGDTTEFLANTTPSCGGFSGGAPSPLGRDVVYSFTTDRPLKLTAKLDMTTGGYDGVLTLRSSCGGSSADVACKGGVGAYSPGLIDRVAVGAGTHFLTVDNGFNAQGRRYTLDVTLAP